MKKEHELTHSPPFRRNFSVLSYNKIALMGIIFIIIVFKIYEGLGEEN